MTRVDVVTMAPLLLRPKHAAAALSVSLSQILKWERAGLLTPVRLTGLRTTWYDTDQVRALARQIIAGTITSTEHEAGHGGDRDRPHVIRAREARDHEHGNTVASDRPS